MYRARIVSVHKNGATADVIFIDFGNRDTCSEFYKIDGDLLALPAGARPIKLLVNSGVEETKENLVKLEEKLIESEIEVNLDKCTLFPPPPSMMDGGIHHGLFYKDSLSSIPRTVPVSLSLNVWGKMAPKIALAIELNASFFILFLR